MARPRVELDWEEGLFRGLLSLWHRWAPGHAEPGPGAVLLEDEKGALSVLAQLLSAEPVRLLPARDVGGIRGRDLLLPRCFDLAPDHETNRRFLIVRTAISAAMRRLSRDRPRMATGPATPLDSLRLAHDAIEWLTNELPAFAREHEAALGRALQVRPDPTSLRGRARLLEESRQRAMRGDRPWLDAGLREAIERAPVSGPESRGIPIWGELIETIDAEDVEHDTPEEGHRESDVESEVAAPALEALRRVELDPREKEEAVLVHNFEKVETLDRFDGNIRDTDGADELEAHIEALEEVDLGDLVRDDDDTHSILRADLSLGLDVPDVRSIGPDEHGIPYDEWDARKKRYRRNWCTVYPSAMRAANPSWGALAVARHGRLIRELRRRLEVHRTELRPRDRQFDGEDVDLAALVDAHGARCAGRGLDPRLYVRQERRRRSFATTVLLDVSLSTDAWVGDHRVLDIAREAILVLGEVTDQLGDQLQLLAFASHTRNRCRVWELKAWGDAWSLARDRLGAIEPQGYTRIGPAIRHAAAGLASTPADRRLLLLVSDGKPTDYDRYEGRYGIADIRQALRETERQGVHSHALAVDEVARAYLPPMFGPGSWDILTHPDRLPEVLTTVYGRLTSG
ncbi:MAG TPA: VWA domain-containing protein [Deltaproteobacteria bacterium]|nr:VWA domain-containing protein [Deltaproteobacteria bacterium]